MPQICRIFHKESRDTESKAALKSRIGNVGRLIKFLRFFYDLTNCKNLFGCRPTSSRSETSLFTATVVVECWSDALQKDHGKQLSGDGE